MEALSRQGVVVEEQPKEQEAEECAPEAEAEVEEEEEEEEERKWPQQGSRAGSGPCGAKRRPAIAPLKVTVSNALQIHRWGEGTQEGLLPPS